MQKPLVPYIFYPPLAIILGFTLKIVVWHTCSSIQINCKTSKMLTKMWHGSSWEQSIWVKLTIHKSMSTSKAYQKAEIVIVY